MRYYIVLLVFALVAWTNAEEDFYPDKYDYIDVDQILANDRMREQYYNCFIDKGPCATADAMFFKQYLPEAMATNCKKCTDMQKEKFDKISDWYDKNQPDKWNEFVASMLDNIKKYQLNKE
ncbi:chemosensory protein 1 [Colletes latitarsis]|uniref:chemosensory protein 1 n=1 Tax=Colletes latitarsis TaxID=2605962 RepID=UPI0040355552